MPDKKKHSVLLRRRAGKTLQFSIPYGMTATISKRDLKHSDYPGGAKTFYRLMIIWSRDLNFGHDFIRVRDRIYCIRCGLSPQKMFKREKPRRRAGNSAVIGIDLINLRRNLSSHRLRFLIRNMLILVGDCNESIVQKIHDS